MSGLILHARFLHVQTFVISVPMTSHVTTYKQIYVTFPVSSSQLSTFYPLRAPSSVKNFLKTVLWPSLSSLASTLVNFRIPLSSFPKLSVSTYNLVSKSWSDR